MWRFFLDGERRALATAYTVRSPLQGKQEWLRYLAVAKAGDEVIVDHAGGLHEGVADRRADKTEAAFL